MLNIRAAQIAIIEAPMLQAYADDMCLILREHYRDHLERLGDAETRSRILHGNVVARSLGLTDAGEIGMFVELTVLFGSGFELRVDDTWVSAILEGEPRRTLPSRIGTLYEIGLTESEGRLKGPDGEAAGD